MNERYDKLKIFRIEEESQLINFEGVSLFAKAVTNELVQWSNENIYNSLNGTLSFNMPLSGSPNAVAIADSKDYLYNHTIEITFSMCREIYRDAFTFPLISKRIETETKYISNFNETISHVLPTAEQCMFLTGIPVIPIESCRGVLKPYLTAFLKVFNENNKDERINQNDVVCRFVMFEITLAWVFFHELGHLLQRHAMLKSNNGSTIESKIEECNNYEAIVDLSGQAREILADIEGLDLTLKYMRRKNILQPQSFYLLFCGISCMYQRFYQRYDENLNISEGTHPHPVIRNEFSERYLLNYMLEYLELSTLSWKLQIAYLIPRAHLMCGSFWAYRLEKDKNGELPSYMLLQIKDHEPEKKKYIDTLGSELIKIIPIIKQIHMHTLNSIHILEKVLTKL